MIFGSGFIVILSIFEVCRAYTPAANPSMLSHASIDVGNIISIVIPESPDENINIDQLTEEFRQQLQRIKKQSRASKVEHGLVTLKRVLPEMSKEEKRKTLPLIRRVLHGRRISSQGNSRNWTNEISFDQSRNDEKYEHDRSVDDTNDRRIQRNYEEMNNREEATIRNDITNGKEFRRIDERVFVDHPEDSTKRVDQMRKEDLNVLDLRKNGERQEDRVIFPKEEDVKFDKTFQVISSYQNWNDQTRSDARIYPQTSTIDCDYKLDNTARPKVLVNDILRNEKFIERAKPSEIGTGNIPEEINTDGMTINQRMSLRKYPVMRPDGIDYTKRSVKEFRSFEAVDEPSFVDFPKEFNVKAPTYSHCIDATKNRPSEVSKKFPTIGNFDDGNAPNYDDRQLVNSSNEPKGSSKVYETFGEKTTNPGLSYVQTEQGDFRPKTNEERKTPDSQRTIDYDNSGLTLRTQRAINVTTASDQISKLNPDTSIFQRLNHLLKSQRTPILSYNRFVHVYDNANESHDDESRKTFTETKKSKFTPSLLTAQPSSSTIRDISISNQPIINMPRISTTKILPLIRMI